MCSSWLLFVCGLLIACLALARRNFLTITNDDDDDRVLSLQLLKPPSSDSIQLPTFTKSQDDFTAAREFINDYDDTDNTTTSHDDVPIDKEGAPAAAMIGKDGPAMIHLANMSSFGDAAYVSLASLAHLTLCPEKWVGETHRKADVVVGRCGPVPGSARRGSIAYCVPPLYGTARAVVLEDIREHMRMGVDHAYVYDTECEEPLDGDPRLITHLCMKWVRDVLIHSRGQNWSIHECLLRAARDGWEWVLAKDVDEAVTASALPAPDDAGLLRTLAQRRDVDVITFGRMHGRTPWMRCRNNPYMCVGWKGRRKWMARARSVWTAQIHEVPECMAAQKEEGASCRTLDLNSSQIWLNHSPRRSTYREYVRHGMPRG
ncbi:hypothetical protein RI054_08g40990 [Pseudoscourfieldia marina]